MKTIRGDRSLAILLLGLYSCASAQGAQGERSVAVPPSAPSWVLDGSRIEGRKIFGVGSASNIRNKELALATAQNRGRSEISRLVSTYSASLMKDYQSSTSGFGKGEYGEQSVEQAIRTYSAELLLGTQQSDAWYHPGSGTWYVRMILDMDKAETLAASPGGNMMDQWVRENQDRVLGELEQEMRPRPSAPPPSPVVGTGSDIASGPRPSWVDGDCDRVRYICGSGEGGTPLQADERARAALSLVFEANIESVTKSFQSAARELNKRTGETWTEVETISDYSLVSTSKTLSLSDIGARWVSPKYRIWSLAVLDRAKASSVFLEKIHLLDAQIEQGLRDARMVEDPMVRLPKLRRVLTNLGERAALESDYRGVSTTGRAPISPVTWQDVVALIEETSTNLSVRMDVQGVAADRIEGCLEEAFTSKGYQLSAQAGAEDVRIEVETRSTEQGRVAGSQVVQVQVVVRLINGRSGKTVRTMRGSTTATRPSISAAEQTAAAKLCRQKVPDIIDEIDRSFN